MATKLSTVVAASPAADLVVVQEMAEQLEEYIQAGEVYRTIAVDTPEGEERVQTSGGDLLARLHKLTAQAGQLSADQQQALVAAQSRIEQTCGRQSQQFQELLLREAKARLNSLRWFLDDCSDNRRECRVQYPFEIRNRQRIAEIRKALDAEMDQQLADGVASIDKRLQSLISGNEFVWDRAVADVYPRREYWYLYGLPVG